MTTNTVETHYSVSGNTSTSTHNIRARRWFNTLNNPTLEEIEFMSKLFVDKKWNYMVGFHIGKVTNTKHIHFYISANNAIKFDYMKKLFPRARLEKAKGSDECIWNYMIKDGKGKKNFEFKVIKKKLSMKEIQEQEDKYLMEEMDKLNLYDWEKDILNIIEGDVDPRKIYWYWEPKGNSGKSTFCKYIDLKYEVCLAEGKSGDIFNQVKVFLEEFGRYPKVIIIDVPRSNLGYVNYTAIEKLKNGLVYSGKYEGKKLRFRKPHVIVFANEEPRFNEMSMDRWQVVRI